MNRLTAQMISIAVLLLSVINGCQKTPINPSRLTTDQQLISAARQYFNEQTQIPAALTGNMRLDCPKSPDWTAAWCITTSKGQAVVVPVIYQKHLVVGTSFAPNQLLALSELTKLLVYKEGSAYHMQLITAFPDSNSRNLATRPFTGVLFVETWQGQSLVAYKYTQGQILTRVAQSSASSATPSRVATTGAKTTEGIIASCSTISGYNYSADNPDETYAWTEPAGCEYESIAGAEGPGLSPGEYTGLGRPGVQLATIVINPPNNIIGNIADYLKCFSNYGGSDHTYTVTVCVDQPVPGSREAWAQTNTGVAGSSSGANPVDAGHTFLVLSENFSGYSIVRNVGFYPQTKVYPWSTSAQGQLNDDDGHTYDISLTVTVDNGQFFNILNYISQGNNVGYMYDLNTNNCTSFVLHAMDAGDVILPSTVGTWPDGGSGNDPGDLGEDIRNMPLSSNMTRNTTYNDHPNQYTCN